MTDSSPKDGEIEGRLEQLFENLFRNAVEHGGEGPTVRAARSSTGFFVVDDGPGIPEGERNHVFDHGHTSSDSGTGFGLSIVATIVDAHGWDVAVGGGNRRRRALRSVSLRSSGTRANRSRSSDRHRRRPIDTLFDWIVHPPV